MPKVLAALGLVSVSSLDRGKPTRWRLSARDFAVDFLSPSFDEKEGPQKLEALGLWSQGLHFLDFLIRDPVPATAPYREGVHVQIPHPERFAIHKPIVASRGHGPGRAKGAKDIAQAQALAAVLSESRPEELKSAYDEAVNEGAAWRKAIDDS